MRQLERGIRMDGGDVGLLVGGNSSGEPQLQFLNFILVGGNFPGMHQLQFQILNYGWREFFW